MPKLLSIGIGLVDVYAFEGMMYPGGNEFNLAYYARELGAESAFMGVFGSDQVGKTLARLCREQGIDLSHSRFEQGQSNFATIELVRGDRVFKAISRDGVTDLYPIRLDKSDLTYAAGYDVVCASYASRLKQPDFERLAQAGARLCYDFSDGFTPATLQAVCPLLGFGLFSCGHLGPEGARQVLRQAAGLGCAVPIATLGEQGSLAYVEERFYEQPAQSVQAIDTMGAGDSYLAAFLVNWFQNVQTHGKPRPQKCMEAASAFAGKNVCRRGSIGFGVPVDLGQLGATKPL